MIHGKKLHESRCDAVMIGLVLKLHKKAFRQTSHLIIMAIPEISYNAHMMSEYDGAENLKIDIHAYQVQEIKKLCSASKIGVVNVDSINNIFSKDAYEISASPLEFDENNPNKFNFWYNESDCGEKRSQCTLDDAFFDELFGRKIEFDGEANVTNNNDWGENTTADGW